MPESGSLNREAYLTYLRPASMSRVKEEAIPNLAVAEVRSGWNDLQPQPGRLRECAEVCCIVTESACCDFLSIRRNCSKFVPSISQNGVNPRPKRNGKLSIQGAGGSSNSCPQTDKLKQRAIRRKLLVSGDAYCFHGGLHESVLSHNW